MLIKGLPRDALVRTPVEERGRAPWTAELELMAQLIEMTSVLASERRIKKPVKVPRPDQPKKRRMRTTARQASRPAEGPGVSPYGAAIAALGGAQPSRKRSQLDPPDDDEEQTA